MQDRIKLLSLCSDLEGCPTSKREIQQKEGNLPPVLIPLEEQMLGLLLQLLLCAALQRASFVCF